MSKPDRITTNSKGQEVTAWYSVNTETLSAANAALVKSMREAYATYTGLRDKVEGALAPSAIAFMSLEGNEELVWSHKFGMSFAAVPKKVKASKRTVSLK